MISDCSAILAWFAQVPGGWCASVSRWHEAVCLLTCLVVLSVAACSDSPGDSDGPEPVPVAPGTDAPLRLDTALPLEDDGPTSPDPGSTGNAPPSTLPPATVGAAGSVDEADPAPVPETEMGTEPVSSTDEAGGKDEVTDPVPEGEQSGADAAAEPSGRRPAGEIDLLLSGPFRPDTEVRVDRGEIRAITTRTVAPGRRLVYALEAVVGQTLTAALDAPSGVWLELSLGDDVVVSRAGWKRSRRRAVRGGWGWSPRSMISTTTR